MFDAQVEAVVDSAVALGQLADDFGRLPEIARSMDDIEHRADGITHELANRADAMFVTPFDKEDISNLFGTLDDIVDHLESAVSRMALYHVREPPDALRPLARLMNEIAPLLATAVKSLRQIKSRDEMRQLFIEIHRVENESDEVYLQALSRLYDQPGPTPESLLQLMKSKEILDRLEAAVDKCEDAANVVESIVVKYG